MWISIQTPFNISRNDSGITNLRNKFTNEVGALSEDTAGSGTIFARLKAIRDSIAAGGSGATPEQLAEINHLIESVESKLPKQERLLADGDDRAEAFGNTVEGFEAIPSTDVAAFSAVEDIVITRRGTAANEMIEKSGSRVAFGDSLQVYDAVSQTYSTRIPANSSLRLFASQNSQFSVGFNLLPENRPAMGSPYNVRSFVAYTRGLGNVNVNVLGDVSLNKGFFLDGIDAADITTRGRSWDGDPYELEYIDDGVVRKAAIVFAIPERQPNGVKYRDPGYVGVFLEDSTHPTINLQFTSTQTDKINMERKSSPDTTFLSTDSNGIISTVYPAYYEAALLEGPMEALFGGVAMVANDHRDATTVTTTNGGLITQTQFSITTREERNLNMAQYRFESAQVSPLTTHRMSMGSLQGWITNTIIRPLVPFINSEVVIPPVQYVKRQRYVHLFESTSTVAPLNIANSVALASTYKDFTARIVDFWYNASKIIAYVTNSNRYLSSWARNNLAALAQFDISSLSKDPSTVAALPIVSNSRQFGVSAFATSAANFNHTTELYATLLFQYGSNPSLTLNLHADEIRGSGSALTRLQQAFAVEERYIDSSITNWYRDTGLNGPSSVLPGFTSTMFEGVTYTATSAESLFGLVWTRNRAIKNYVSDVDESNQLIPLLPSSQVLTHRNPSSLNRASNVLGWRVNNKCTIDIQLIQTEAEDLGVLRLRRVRVGGTNITTAPVVISMTSANPVAAPVRARAEFEAGDILFLTSTDAANTPVPSIRIDLQAFAL